jgi:hypothetical protein
LLPHPINRLEIRNDGAVMAPQCRSALNGSQRRMTIKTLIEATLTGTASTLVDYVRFSAKLT